MDRALLSVTALGWVVAAGVAVGAWKFRPHCPAPQAEATPPVRVVARVDGEEVRWEDLEFEVLARQAAAGVLYEGPAGERQLDELRKAVLDALVDRLLLVKEATRRGYRATEEEVRTERDRLLGRVPQRTELARRLAAGRYGEQLVRFARWSVLGNKLLEDLRAKVKVTAEQVEAYYRENRDRLFRQPPSVVAEEVVLPTRERAEAARRELLRGRSTEEVAKEFGTEPRRTLLVQGATDPERTRAAWGLPQGGVSEVVKTIEGGYAVLKVLSRQPERTTPLEEARPTIERILRTAEQNRLLAELVTDLRSRAKVERYWPPAESPTPAVSPSPGR
ncbi:MAG: peptidyl-prolyl cis-trans isomerase [Armatimonadota bacterium]|nr:peptidyl-prolyl cis-trans isomerase [Armatimonadota bacterium]MDR7570978.1 peptidyl-prolyl cis-trans isomerase [Armatimonadota bacterium]MDR7614752.1 peptidyl-prolyl cis-trans isomerase [Armatimonadota bacterium]